MAPLAYSSQKVTEEIPSFLFACCRHVALVKLHCVCKITQWFSIADLYLELYVGETLLPISETSVTTSDKCDSFTVRLCEKGHGVTRSTNRPRPHFRLWWSAV